MGAATTHHHLATSKLFLLLLPIICFSTFIHLFAFGFAATPNLLSQEVKALRDIGKKLGKKDWDFSKDPCSGEGNWNVSDWKGFESTVRCDCSFNHNSTCRVIRIALKAQNLSGIVPPEFSTLRYLKELDLSRNCLTGTIPPEWATMRLVDLSFMGNRLSGPFPRVLTNITTLRNLSIEGNHFSGPIPAEIGKLVNLEKFVLSSNAFTGNLPAQFAKLVSLTDMRISDNNFTGKIPRFIGEWTKIQKLHIRGGSLQGPIPSSISFLTRLHDLRISDLKGEGSVFPPLSKMKLMKTLVLSSCLLSGEIPSYIGKMEKLKHQDLGFNSLTGEIPASFANLTKLDFMNLTRNKLTGYAPLWILERIKNVDISYNNFTWDRSSQPECPRGSVAHPCKKPNDRKKVIIAAGTVAAAVFLTLVILCIMWRTGYLRYLASADKELAGLDLHTGQFTLRQIKAATNNFDLANKIGEGGFGSVYKGLLSDGAVIAVKQLSSKSKQGGREFVNEMGMISALQHPNLVKLYGCCVEGNHMMVIYEYMENNCLSRALFRNDPACKLKLDWPARRNICLGVARGLAYLHEESRIRIVHGDIKTSNVLLDKYLNAKISDFGLAKLNEDDNTHISTQVAGTMFFDTSGSYIEAEDWPSLERGKMRLEAIREENSVHFTTSGDI